MLKPILNLMLSDVGNPRLVQREEDAYICSQTSVMVAYPSVNLAVYSLSSLSMSTDLEKLRDLIVNSVDIVVEACRNRGCDFPGLDEPTDSTKSTTKAVRDDPDVADAIRVCVAAASQLVVSLQQPATTLFNVAMRVSCDFLFRVIAEAD